MVRFDSLATSRRKIPNRGERSVAAVRQRWEGVLELLDQCGRIVEWKKGGKVRPGVEEERSGFLLVGQVGADVYHLNYARGLPFGAYSAITACPPDSVQPSLISARIFTSPRKSFSYLTQPRIEVYGRPSGTHRE